MDSTTVRRARRNTFALLLAAVGSAESALSQSTNDFVSLFDGATLTGWVVEQEGTIAVRDSVLVVEGPRGWLRSEEEYRDFELVLEFRLTTDGADSGVFLRAHEHEPFGRGWPGGAYQVQLRDMHQPSRFLPLGQIYRHGQPGGETGYDEALALNAYRGVGTWHELRIQAAGSVLTVSLDGREITRAEDVTPTLGHLGFQAETGTVEYRSVRLRVLN